MQSALDDGDDGVWRQSTSRSLLRRLFIGYSLTNSSASRID